MYIVMVTRELIFIIGIPPHEASLLVVYAVLAKQMKERYRAVIACMSAVALTALFPTLGDLHYEWCLNVHRKQPGLVVTCFPQGVQLLIWM